MVCCKHLSGWAWSMSREEVGGAESSLVVEGME